MNRIEPTPAPVVPEPLAKPWHRRRGYAVGILALAVLTFGVYEPALHTQLVADDFYLVGQIGFSEALAYFTKTFGFGRNEYRPLTALSFAVDRWLWHENPEGYHLTNLGLHAGTAGLLFLLIQALTADFALAWLAGALFVIHPIHHSRAAWISARDGLVCAVFLLGALWLFARSRRQNWTSGRVIAIVLSGCALLAYEGAVILPALLFGVEFLFFGSGPLRGRFGPSLRQTAAFWILAAGYVGWWQITFSGSLGAYDLSLAPRAILGNYGRLLSALFYGHRSWVFALAYLVLLALCYRPLRARLRLAAFAAGLLIVSFVPYCFTHGFAYRFGYLSALGLTILFAAGLVGNLRSGQRPRQITAACLGILLSASYVVEDRKILTEWAAAGTICAHIPQAVRKQHPNFPARTVLVFTGIPHQYGRAYVFPTGLDAAIQRQYSTPVVVRQAESGVSNLSAEVGRGAYVFEYREGQDTLQEWSPGPGSGGRGRE